MKIAVIGGGAAGMMASVTAARAGAEVILFEKNEKLGKKVYITGKGRCNVTNACEAEEFFPKVITNRKFLYSSFYGFSNEAMMEFLKAEGLSLKTERGNRVFPVSDKASDVIRTLQRAMERSGVKIRLLTEVQALKKNGENGFQLSFLSQGRKEEESFDRVILATGGLSYPSTGSTGDGYRFAKELGHTVTECSPALVPFVTEESFVKELMGLSLRNVQVTVKEGKKTLFSEFGEMLFTHFGVSGPAVLSGSSVCAKALRKGKLRMEIDLKPALTREMLDMRLLREFEEKKNRQLKNTLGALLPASMVPVFLRVSGLDPEKECNGVTVKERETMISFLKCFPLTLTGLRGYEEAIVTQGGVSVKEIDPGTMESKKVPGLYFAGELMDVDACTGGYNLQIAWSTAHAAGEAAAEG